MMDLIADDSRLICGIQAKEKAKMTNKQHKEKPDVSDALPKYSNPLLF